MVVPIKESDNGTKKRTRDEVGKLNDAITEEARKELEDVWNRIYNDALANCPIDTGTLVGSIRLTTDSSKDFTTLDMPESEFSGQGKAVSLFNGMLTAGDDSINPKSNKASVEYAALVHDGHMAKNGGWVEGSYFLTKALEDNEDALFRAIQKAIDKASEKQ